MFWFRLLGLDIINTQCKILEIDVIAVFYSLAAVWVTQLGRWEREKKAVTYSQPFYPVDLLPNKVQQNTATISTAQSNHNMQEIQSFLQGSEV